MTLERHPQKVHMQLVYMSELQPLFKEGKVVNNLWYPLFFDLWYIYLHLVLLYGKCK